MLTFLLTVALAAPLPAGARLEDAAAVHISASGFERLGELVEGLLPSTIPIDSLALPFACDAADPAPLTLTVDGASIALLSKSVLITPRDGLLSVDIELTLAASSSTVHVSGGCTALLPSIEQTCALSIPQDPEGASSGATPPLTASVHLDLALGLDADGHPAVSASNLDVSLGHIGNPLVPGADGCLLGDLFDTLLALSPTLLDSQLSPVVADATAGLEGQIGDALVDALSALTLDTSLALGENPIDLRLSPSALRVDDQGLFIGLGASLTPGWRAPCVPRAEGSRATSTGWPGVGADFATDTPAYEVGLFVNRDLTDHVLYVAWQAGLLCQDVGALATLPIGTDFLGTLYGESLAAYFPEDQDATWTLVPHEAPTTRFTAATPITALVSGLALEVTASLDGRMARIAETWVDAEADVGVTVSDGALTPSLTLPAERMRLRDGTSEYLTPGFSDGVATTLPSLVGGLLPTDLLPTVPVAVAGATLSGLTWAIDAPDDAQWLAGFASLNVSEVQPIAVDSCGGCSEDGGVELDVESLLGCDASSGGCDSAEGCDGGGCTLRGPSPSRLTPVLAAALIALRRRRYLNKAS
jgi:hypothetical protein